MGFSFDFGFEGEGVALPDAKLALFFAAAGDEKDFGRASGPVALADASRYVEFFDMQGELVSLDIGIYAEISGSAEPLSLAIKRFEESISMGVFPVIIADNRFALPRDSSGPLVALWGKIGRMECEESLLNNGTGTVLLGVRAATEQVYHTIVNKVTMVTSESVCTDRKRLEKIVDEMEEPVHLSIDYDVLAPSVVETSRSIEPGGLSWYDLLFVLERLFRGPGVQSASIVGTENIGAKTPAALFGAQMLTIIAGLIGTVQGK